MLHRQGKIAFHISGIGQEAAQVGAAFALRRGHDWVAPYYRDLALMLTLGLAPRAFVLSLMGRLGEPTSGARQMPSHWSLRSANVVSHSSPVATQACHVKNGFYKLVCFTPPPNTLPPTTYGYNDGFSNNFELTSVATSYGGVLEFVYSNHDFYFNTTKLDSKVVSQKRITFNQGENAQTWNYVYPTYQGVSSGTATVDGPEFDTSATHYAYQCAQADRWKIGLQTSLALSDGSYSASRTWTYHEISTTPWSVLNLPMGTPKGALILSMTESPTGDSTQRSEYDYLRGGGTSVKRYRLIRFPR